MAEPSANRSNKTRQRTNTLTRFRRQPRLNYIIVECMCISRVNWWIHGEFTAFPYSSQYYYYIQTIHTQSKSTHARMECVHVMKCFPVNQCRWQVKRYAYHGALSCLVNAEHVTHVKERRRNDTTQIFVVFCCSLICMHNVGSRVNLCVHNFRL